MAPVSRTGKSARALPFTAVEPVDLYKWYFRAASVTPCFAATSTRGIAPLLASATTVAQNSAPRIGDRDIAREHHPMPRPTERHPGPDGYGNHGVPPQKQQDLPC